MTAPLRIVVLGLSLSSSWGNGHATTYRALLKATAARGHDVLFLERDAPWYAGNRDLPRPGFCRLDLYEDLQDLRCWADEIAKADAVVVGSYVPQGAEVGRWVKLTAEGVIAFYDIDTPVTLAGLERGDLDYLARTQISDYDVYFSFTGGPTLRRLEEVYGSPAARALYCSVDPQIYRPVKTATKWDLSYLGTYSPDRQLVLERLLFEPARRAPHLRFVVAGPQYPATIDWPANVERLEHVAPADHPAFYSASRFTLNVTRADMVAAGYSPSVRLFEAAACGAPIISDTWEGIETLFSPGEEITLAREPGDVLAALEASSDQRDAISVAARSRILDQHTAAHRAAAFECELRLAAARRRASKSPAPPSLQPEECS